MNRIFLSLLCFSLPAALAPALAATTMTYDLTDTTKAWYTPLAPADATPTFNTALADATAWINQNPGGTAVISFGSGSYEFVCPTNAGGNASAIDLSNINPGTDANGVTGRLIITGQGNLGANATHLGFTDISTASDLTTTTGTTTDISELEFGGSNFSHVTITQLHLQRIITNNDGTNRGVTQGTVVNVGANDVQIDIPAGFPVPPVLWLYDPHHAGHYMRAYDYVNGVPQLDPASTNTQQHWASATYVGNTVTPVDTQLWEFDGMPDNPPYTTGQIVGIKAVHGSGSARFIGFNDLVIDHIRFTDEGHMQFEDGSTPSDNLTVSNCQTDRGDEIAGTIPCLATDGGGFQFHVTGSNVNTTNCTSTGQGDDAIAYFYTLGGYVTNNILTDDFARGINIEPTCPHINDGNTPEIITYSNQIIRSGVIPSNLNETPPGPATDTPTLPQWMLFSLASILAAAGLLHLKKRPVILKDL